MSISTKDDKRSPDVNGLLIAAQPTIDLMGPALIEAVLEGTPDPIFVKDLSSRFVLLNSACARVLGRPRAEIYGKTASEVINSDYGRHMDRVDAQLFKSGQTVVAEEAALFDGEVRIFLSTKSALRNDSGQVVGLIGIAQDISERKSMERALAESEARYRQLAEAMPQLVWTADAEGTLEYVNEHFMRVTGLTLADARRDGCSLIHSLDRAAYDLKWNEALRTGASYQVECRVRVCPADSYRWFLARLHPVRNEAGTVLRWIGTAVDIDDQKRASMELKRREEQLRLAQSAAHTGAWTWHQGSNTLTLSPEFYQLLGIPLPESDLGIEFFIERIVPEDRQAVLDSLRDSPGDIRLEYRVQVLGQVRWLLTVGRCVESEYQGEYPGGVLAGVSIDITSQKNAEEELARQAAELARSNADLQRFAYVASHDLQEPLRNMSICSELLFRTHREQFTENGRQLLDMISAGAKRGQALTRSLLSYARVIGAANTEFVPVNLNDAVLQAQSNLRTLAAEAGAVITCGNLPVVRGDSIQLVQLIQNLLENALKYRGDRTPIVHISAQDQGARVLVFVQDNGMGIAEEFKMRIFDPFERLLGPEVSGSGIGLATCKRIVERHEGSIWVESTVGDGSTFFFTLPKP